MKWKQSLGGYITAIAENEFSIWYIGVIDAFTDTWFNTNQDWISEYNTECSNLFESLYHSGFEPAEAARIIEQTKK